MQRRRASTAPCMRTSIFVFLILSVSFTVNLWWTKKTQGKVRGAFWILRRRLSPLLRNHGTTHKACLVYDKPPRTGSSTISNALRTCWKSHGYKILDMPFDDKKPITALLNITHDRVGVTGSHFSLSPSEILYALSSCAKFYYITSTRRMVERIASKAKYEVSHARTYKNTTLSEEQMKVAWKNANRDDSSEKRLERYPFTEDTLDPDFVVRYENFSFDLRNLLRAFECKENFYSKNLHIVEQKPFSEEDVSGDDPSNDTLVESSFDGGYNLSEIPLLYGDARHKRMTKFAEVHNEDGLIKAVTFQRQNLQ